MSSKTVSVYRIKCSQTGKCYIGRTQNLKQRIRQHFRELDTGRKSERYPEWQADYELYGFEGFETDVIMQNIPKECGYVSELLQIFLNDTYNLSQNLRRSNQTNPVRNRYFNEAFKMLTEQHRCCFCGNCQIKDVTDSYFYYIDRGYRFTEIITLYSNYLSAGMKVFRCLDCKNEVKFTSRYFQRKEVEQWKV